MKYIIDDKQLNAKTFIQFVNQIWLGNYDWPKPQNALTKTINITVWDNTIWVGCLRILSCQTKQFAANLLFLIFW